MKKTDPLEYFANSIESEFEFVKKHKREGGKIAGIYCEYTPREIFLAAGAIPICLCGTTSETIPEAEKILPSNLCPLIKSSFGYFSSKSCPFMEMADIIVAETTCDGKKKMYEIMSGSKRLEVIELTQKSDSKSAFTHWKSELARLINVLEKEFAVKITEEKLSAAIRHMNRERELLKEAFMLGSTNPSIVSGMELALVRFRIAGFPKHLDMLEKFISKIKQRAKTRTYAAKHDASRIILTGCPTGQGSEKLIQIIEECGAVVVCQEACSGIKPVFTNVDDRKKPLDAIAEKYFHLPCSCLTPNKGRLDLLAEIADGFAPDGVVDLVWQACHTYNIESHQTGEFVREKLRIPYIKIETDYSHSDKEQLKVRIGAFLEMVKTRQLRRLT